MKKFLIDFLCLALCLCLCSCGESGTEYTLYYVNQSCTKITSYSYYSTTEDTHSLLMEFVGDMQKIDEKGSLSVIPSGAEIRGISISGGIATLNIGGSLDGESANRLTLFYAAITKALTQISDVSGVIINLNGESVKDYNGNPMGVMRNSRFVNNAVDDPDDYREQEVTLYYGSEDGTQLVKTKTTVAYKSSTPIERVVIERIISGPSSGELITENGEKVIATLPSTLTLLGINIKDRICYVNIDDKILKETLAVSDSVIVYSIVNSLVELNTIDAVMITINGSNDAKMPMGLSLATSFKFNNTIIK